MGRRVCVVLDHRCGTPIGRAWMMGRYKAVAGSLDSGLMQSCSRAVTTGAGRTLRQCAEVSTS